MTYATQEELRERLREMCEPDKQGQVAEQLGLSQSLISLILAGKRSVSSGVAERMGYTKMTLYAPLTGAANRGGADMAPPIATP